MIRFAALIIAATFGLGLSLLAAPAPAARPALDLSRADRAAQHEAGTTVAAWDAAYDPDEADVSNPGPGLLIASYSLDPCERETRSRATCDITYELSDRTTCDAIIVVGTTRSGRIFVGGREMVCADD